MCTLNYNSTYSRIERADCCGGKVEDQLTKREVDDGGNYRKRWNQPHTVRKLLLKCATNERHFEMRWTIIGGQGPSTDWKIMILLLLQCLCKVEYCRWGNEKVLFVRKGLHVEKALNGQAVNGNIFTIVLWTHKEKFCCISWDLLGTSELVLWLKISKCTYVIAIFEDEAHDLKYVESRYYLFFCEANWAKITHIFPFFKIGR